MSVPATSDTAARAVTRDLRWTVAGAAAPALLMAVTNILLARVLGVAAYGEWVFFTQVAGYTATVLVGVATFTLSYHIPRGDYDARDLLAATGLGSLAVGLTGAVLAVALAPVALESPSAGVVAAGAALVLAVCVQYWAFAVLDALLRFAARVRFGLANAALTVAVVLALTAAGRLDPVLALTARTAAFGLAALLAWRLARAALRTQVDDTRGEASHRPPHLPHLSGSRGLRLVLGDSWPVTAASVLGAASTAGVLTAIGAFGGQAAVGAAGVGVLLAQPIALLSVGLSAVLLPHGARDRQAHRGLRRMGLGVSAAAFGYAALASVLGRPLFELITGEPPSGEMLAIALLLLWGNWLKQVAGVDVVMLRARGRLREGLAVALAGSVPVAPLVLVAALASDDWAVQVAVAWVAAQGIACLTMLRWFRVRDQVV